LWSESEAPARRGRRKARERADAAAAAPPTKAIGDGERRGVDLARLTCFFSLLFWSGVAAWRGTGEGFDGALTFYRVQTGDREDS
jgi:hypothetical protein